MLGAVLEVAAGKTLDQVLDERIFEPLGMDETPLYLSSNKAERIAEPNFGAMANNTCKSGQCALRRRRAQFNDSYRHEIRRDAAPGRRIPWQENH